MLAVEDVGINQCRYKSSLSYVCPTELMCMHSYLVIFSHYMPHKCKINPAINLPSLVTVDNFLNYWHYISFADNKYYWSHVEKFRSTTFINWERISGKSEKHRIYVTGDEFTVVWL